MKVGGRPLFDGLLVLNGWRPRMSSNVGFIVLVRRLGFWVIVCLLGFSVVVLVRLTGPLLWWIKKGIQITRPRTSTYG